MFENLSKLEENYIERDPNIHVSFMNGARVDLSGFSRKKYRVEFFSDKLEFSSEIGTGFFASPSKRYFVPWVVKIYDGEKQVHEEKLELSGKRIFIMIDSSSIGDTLAWVPQAIKFSKLHNCKLAICTFHNYLFSSYEGVEWIEPGSAIGPCYASYNIGYFIGEDKFSYTPFDPKTSSLGKVASDILGIDYEEIRPELRVPETPRPLKEKYVCIATTSTANAKHWHRENGWQDVVDYLVMIGYRVAVIQKENTHLNNVIDWTGEIPLTTRLSQLKHAEFFIGIGSGLSWLAWAMKKHVIMISGFSMPYAEFEKDCERIINYGACHGCWNDNTHTFDKGDWNWCPRHKGTSRMFECTKSISAIKVIEAIENTRERI